MMKDEWRMTNDESYESPPSQKKNLETFVTLRLCAFVLKQKSAKRTTKNLRAFPKKNSGITPEFQSSFRIIT